MTDRDALFLYRREQAMETLREAEGLVRDNFPPRSIVNRAWYAVFYALLALFIR